ncbi:hypothetical protein DFH06DRAFT_1291154 [Mycena polygramma]|nr:hypothetical protein DFH06DRAFT_1291154 [Mycena polygramma]
MCNYGFQLLKELWSLPDAAPDANPLFSRARQALQTFGRLGYHLVMPYICLSLSLREQLVHLSTAAHLLLILFATDRAGPNANVDIYQFSTRASNLTEISVILAKRPRWDRGPRRLKLPAVINENGDVSAKADHVSPASWLGDLHVANVVLHSCWMEGRLKAEGIIPGGREMLARCAQNPSFDIFTPLGHSLVRAVDGSLDPADAFAPDPALSRPSPDEQNAPEAEPFYDAEGFGAFKAPSANGLITTDTTAGAPSLRVGNPIAALVSCEERIYLAVGQVNRILSAPNLWMSSLLTFSQIKGLKSHSKFCVSFPQHTTTIQTRWFGLIISHIVIEGKRGFVVEPDDIEYRGTDSAHQVDWKRSTCLRRLTFSMAAAMKWSPTSPCTNYLIQCPLQCGKIIWTYNIEAHCRSARHGLISLNNVALPYTMLTQEVSAMKKLYDNRQNYPRIRVAKDPDLLCAPPMRTRLGLLIGRSQKKIHLPYRDESDGSNLEDDGVNYDDAAPPRGRRARAARVDSDSESGPDHGAAQGPSSPDSDDDYELEYAGDPIHVPIPASTYLLPPLVEDDVDRAIEHYYTGQSGTAVATTSGSDAHTDMEMSSLNTNPPVSAPQPIASTVSPILPTPQAPTLVQNNVTQTATGRPQRNKRKVADRDNGGGELVVDDGVKSVCPYLPTTSTARCHNRPNRANSCLAGSNPSRDAGRTSGPITLEFREMVDSILIYSMSPGSLPCAGRGRWVLWQARDDPGWLTHSVVGTYTPCVTICVPLRPHGALRTSVRGQPAPVVAGYSGGMALGDAADTARCCTPTSPGTVLLRATDAGLARGAARSASLGVEPPVRASRTRCGRIRFASSTCAGRHRSGGVARVAGVYAQYKKKRGETDTEFEGPADKRNSVAGNLGIAENGRLA